MVCRNVRGWVIGDGSRTEKGKQMGMDKILRIDMGAEGGPKATTQPLGDYSGLGGRAMTSLIVSAEVDPRCHPLSAANKLVFAPGMLTGSAASTSGRISVGCKSPLTGGIKEANAGGQAGRKGLYSRSRRQRRTAAVICCAA